MRLYTNALLLSKVCVRVFMWQIVCNMGELKEENVYKEEMRKIM